MGAEGEQGSEERKVSERKERCQEPFRDATNRISEGGVHQYDNNVAGGPGNMAADGRLAHGERNPAICGNQLRRYMGKTDEPFRYERWKGR